MQLYCTILIQLYSTNYIEPRQDISLYEHMNKIQSGVTITRIISHNIHHRHPKRMYGPAIVRLGSELYFVVVDVRTSQQIL